MNPAEVVRLVRALTLALGLPADYTGQVELNLYRGGLTRAHQRAAFDLTRPAEETARTER